MPYIERFRNDHFSVLSISGLCNALIESETAVCASLKFYFYLQFHPLLSTKSPLLDFLGRIAVCTAIAAIVIKLSVGLCVCVSVCRPVDCEKNSGSDPDAVWRGRSDGSMDETDNGVWRSVNRKG